MPPNHSRVLMITGAYPPDVCGVGDYTSRLMAAAPANWELFVERDWSARAALGIVKRLLARRPERVVIQYPTQGYGWSLVPHLLTLVGWLTGRYRTVLALHEYSSLSRKAQFALALTSHLTARIIFTTEVERDRARKSPLFSTRIPTSIIAILSNIPWTDDPPPFAARGIDVAYFGHIRPNKGLEDFLEVAAGLRAANPTVQIAAIGVIPEGYEQFAEMVASHCRAIGVSLMLGLSDDSVGRMLADIRILYLPFPDGVSARRGSVLAGFGNGTLIATRIGDATPIAMRGALIPCDGTILDIPVLQNALRLPDQQTSTLLQAGRQYLMTKLPRDWAHVAALYDAAIAETYQSSPDNVPA